ncbi:hypothetical protein L211DRAFT_490436 [Terfezia boudieri ATCC MYA-4762]|uniref:Uncharacterized protein n=1 Tax=Terfezia boudieri ATCC MYA-4762 TaxID=1051890 RepID=A0A3N4LHL2_9PEZI|nr:hypothetical protein L211DRAFT_490436 [Terfezia boudieri ATCC MYA-4762]
MTTKWTSFLTPPGLQVAESGSEAGRESAKALRKKEKRDKKKRQRDELLEKYPPGSTYKARQTPFTKALLAMVPGNHYAYEEPRFKNPSVLELLKIRLVENAEIEKVVQSPLPSLEKGDPEVHSFLTGAPIKSKGDVAMQGLQLPSLWKQCLSELKYYVDRDLLLELAVNGEEREPLIKSRDKPSRRSKSTEYPLKPIGSLAGANRPLAISFLRAICHEFEDCLAFEDLRYAWSITMYGHRRIRIGPNNEDRIKVHMREDLCWRATKNSLPGVSPREWTSKKRGLGPLFAVITRDWDEFVDVKRSALADLKTLLTILQDRRREAAYTIYDDITSRDTQYFSYIVSVTAKQAPCVSINTLSASGRYLAYMERGDPPPRREELVYSKGRVLSLVETAGRVEFARIMMGLLGRACTRKKVREKEELELEPEEIQVSAPAAAMATGKAWDKAKKKSRSPYFFGRGMGSFGSGKMRKRRILGSGAFPVPSSNLFFLVYIFLFLTICRCSGLRIRPVVPLGWFVQSIIPNSHNIDNPQGKVVPKVTDWINTLEVN